MADDQDSNDDRVGYGRPPKAFQFKPGQWLNLGLPGTREQREYSIYSSPNDDYLEVLVKEIPDGALSPTLRKRKPGGSTRQEATSGNHAR